MMVALVVFALLAAVLGVAATRPGTFRVHRVATVNVGPEQVFPLINDLRRWGDWSPWERVDRSMKKSFSGPTTGKGASYAWEGNKKAGAGTMEIIDAVTPSKVVIKLDFTRPFANHSVVEFTMVPKDGATEVTWSMQGPVPFVGKIFHLFVNMDKVVGKDFEAGLAALKAIAEMG